MNRAEWIERLDFQYKTYSGLWITDKDCKELILLLEEKH